MGNWRQLDPGRRQALRRLARRFLALLSDAVHSLVDAAVSGALLVALVVAQWPADREHPYGHGKVEAVAGAGVALILLFLAAAIAYESLFNDRHPTHPAGRIHHAGRRRRRDCSRSCSTGT